MVFRSLGMKMFDFQDCSRKYLKSKNISYYQHLKWNLKIYFYLTRSIFCSLVFFCSNSKRYRNHIQEDLKNSKLLLASQNYVHYPQGDATLHSAKKQFDLKFILPPKSKKDDTTANVSFFRRTSCHLLLLLLLVHANCLSLMNTLIPLYFEDELLFVLNNALQHFFEWFHQ